MKKQYENELIATFMNVQFTFEFQKNGVKSEFQKKLEYDSNWNELMPVCKKIINMYKDNRLEIFEGLGHCDIERTYKAVVEFIEFWNNPESVIHTWSNVPFPYDPMPKGKIIQYE